MLVVGVNYEKGFTGSRKFDKDSFTRPEIMTFMENSFSMDFDEIIIYSDADFVDCFRPYEVE